MNNKIDDASSRIGAKLTESRAAKPASTTTTSDNDNSTIGGKETKQQQPAVPAPIPTTSPWKIHRQENGGIPTKISDNSSKHGKSFFENHVLSSLLFFFFFLRYRSE